MTSDNWYDYAGFSLTKRLGCKFDSIHNELNNHCVMKNLYEGLGGYEQTVTNKQVLLYKTQLKAT